MKVQKCSLPEFREQFPTQEICIDFLINQKWENGFACIKCKHTLYMKGEYARDRRCKKCGYNESPTANTLFHSIKLSLPLAFEMVFRISVNKKGISSVALCREYGINLKTAYHFRRKIQASMKSSETHPLTGIVHVDEFVYGGVDKGCQGRSGQSDKLKICIAVEIIPAKNNQPETMGRAYALPIENYSSVELKKVFTKHIGTKATIVTDKWTGYKPLKKEYNITQIESNNGANFPCIHNLILNVKSWIRGTHHHISANHVVQYLNEFCFRFNRRTWMEKMPIFVLERIVKSSPKPVILSKRGLYG
jgi:transposase-like protein